MNKALFVTLFSLLFALPLNGAENRVVMITGTSKGIGMATAHYLAEKGYHVYGTTRSSNQIPSENLHYLQVDLCDEGSIQAAVDAVLQKEGRIDILINNAGYALVGPIETLAYRDIQDQMEINFYAPIRFVQAVLPAMRSQESGHIINISSTNAQNTPPFGSMYAASKAALESFSESLCLEVQPFNISVSIVEPWLGYRPVHNFEEFCSSSERECVER